MSCIQLCFYIICASISPLACADKFAFCSYSYFSGFCLDRLDDNRSFLQLGQVKTRRPWGRGDGALAPTVQIDDQQFIFIFKMADGKLR